MDEVVKQTGVFVLALLVGLSCFCLIVDYYFDLHILHLRSFYTDWIGYVDFFFVVSVVAVLLLLIKNRNRFIKKKSVFIKKKFNKDCKLKEVNENLQADFNNENNNHQNKVESNYHIDFSKDDRDKVELLIQQGVVVKKGIGHHVRYYLNK